MTHCRTIVWQRIDFAGIEYFSFDDTGETKKATGHISGVTEENQPFAIKYKIEIDADWKVTAFKIKALDESDRKIEMTSNGQGIWFDKNGRHQPDFDGCFEIDITLTPFTNTLPVKRLNFAADDERKKISVLYIELPEFNIKRVEQFYTRLDEKTFVYEGYPKDFRAEISFDEDGFVADYPELFRRIYP